MTNDTRQGVLLHSAHLVKDRINFYLQKDVGRIVQAHDQRSASDHVVGVGEGDEQYGGQVMDQHDHEILELEKYRREIKRKKRKGKCGKQNFQALCTASKFTKTRHLWL